MSPVSLDKFNCSGTNLMGPLERPKAPSGFDCPDPNKSVPLKGDHVQTQPVPKGNRAVAVSLVKDNFQIQHNQNLDKHLKAINSYLPKNHKGSLQMPEKEIVLNILKESKNDGTIKELATKLDKEKQLEPFSNEMGSMHDQSPRTSLALFALFGAFVLVVEARASRKRDMIGILKEGGVDLSIIDKLDPLDKFNRSRKEKH